MVEAGGIGGETTVDIVRRKWTSIEQNRKADTPTHTPVHGAVLDLTSRQRPGRASRSTWSRPARAGLDLGTKRCADLAPEQLTDAVQLPLRFGEDVAAAG